MGSASSTAASSISGDEGHIVQGGGNQTLWLVAIGAAVLLAVVWLFNKK